MSPRGKLVHLGVEGLEASNRLIDLACKSLGNSPSRGLVWGELRSSEIVLCDSIVRLATTEEQERQLKQTAIDLPQFGIWLDAEEAQKLILSSDEHKNHHSLPLEDGENDSFTDATCVRGALRLSHGCRVIHVPSYLQGLWMSCQHLAKDSKKGDSETVIEINVEWQQIAEHADPSTYVSMEHTSYDTVVMCAGAGIFTHYLGSQTQARRGEPHEASLGAPAHDFPVHLVRGQSIEFVSKQEYSTHISEPLPMSHALLCGKYISPLPPIASSNDHDTLLHRVLVGATHEFQSDPSSNDDVADFLRKATKFMAPALWPNDISNERKDSDESAEYRIDRITSGYRVQSQRGRHGRLPLIGRLSRMPPSLRSSLQLNPRQPEPETWIYSGLSSRGLLYHALFAEWLVDGLWKNDESVLMDEHPELSWWKT